MVTLNLDAAAMTRHGRRIDISDLMRRPVLRALLGLIFLSVLAAVIAPRTMSLESLVSMAPFVGILGIASLGQHLVIQQRGFDLSVAGAISLAAAIVTVFATPETGPTGTVAVVVLALAAGALGGWVNGAVINRLRVPPLVMTIGLNALLNGFVYYVTRAAVHPAPPPLALAAKQTLGGVSILFIIFAVLAGLTAWIIERTRVGRHFILSAVSPNAARTLGVRVELYNIATYCVAGLLFAVAGVMTAGLVVTPTVQCGNPYMLTTVAAVIVGGSPLNGDRGSLAATSIGAIFLVLLNQLVVSLGYEYAIQSMVQAAIILAGVTIPSLLRSLRRPGAGRGEKPNATVAPTGVAAAAGVVPSRLVENPILELSRVRKTFGSTIALAGVDFAAAPGEVHAIIGENGAGKSTLISIAAGVLRATEGEVKIGDKVMRDVGPTAFRDAGISVAFQHPPLPEHLTVRECLALANEDFGRAGGEARAQAVIDRVSLGSLRVNPDDRIADLSIGRRHVVEIARAIASNPRILVLDEPTEPFKEDDVLQLFSLIRSLKAQGVAVIYISHRLNEVEEIADLISVLRDGQLIETRRRADFTRDEIVNMIVGRPLGQVFPHKLGSAEGAAVHFAVERLNGTKFHDISFEARRGEVIGIAGVEGQGQRELMRALAGLETHTGLIELGGQRMSLVNRAHAWRAGVAFVPDDRHHDGLFLSLSVRENLGVGYRDEEGQPFVIDRERERIVVAEAITALKVRTSSPQELVSALSGGNQQKVLMGREIAAAPRVFLADEPTKGVDIGSKSDIYNKLRDLAKAGVTVIISSSDGVELEGLCDRVLVMARGTIAKVLEGVHVSDSEITAANLTAGETTAKRVNDDAERERLGALLNSKWLPAITLSLASMAILFFAAHANMRFLSAYNLGNVQVQLATLALIAFGQLTVMVLGEIDFSAGPLAGLVVVLASYWIPDDASTGTVLLAGMGIVLLTTLISLLQGLIVVALDLPSIVVTLTGFFAIQGVSISLRPDPGGTISYDFVDTMLYRVGPVSAVTVVALLLCVCLERVLFRSSFGRVLRAIGSDRAAATKLGVSPRRIIPWAFAINGALIGLAGLILAATVGVGTGTAGVNYTLMSITAVVLGGAVISGGYGSYVSTLFGAILVQMTFSATAFIQVGVEWQFWLIGLSTLFAAGLFSFGRSRGAHA